MRIAISLQHEYRRYRAHWRRQGGNIVAISALMMVVLIAVLALVIDVGFVAGLRRFMQNGADAAALAAARKIAVEGVTYPRGSFPVSFSMTHQIVLNTATNIASLNRTTGVTQRTTSFTVDVDYCVAVLVSGSPVYNYNSCSNWVTLSSSTNLPDGTYMVRVRVTSTITTFFGGVIGISATTASGSAVAVIVGACPETSTGEAWPFTAWRNQAFNTADANTLFMLWGPNPPGPQRGSWKNLLDFTPPAKWCDGNDPDYQWGRQYTGGNGSSPKRPVTGLVPTGTSCTPYPGDATLNFSGTDSTWNKSGQAWPNDNRIPASCYQGNDESSPDLAVWAAAFYKGTLVSRMKVPTYESRNPSGSAGDGGQNVASGIYGPGPNCLGGAYFFQGQTTIDPLHPTWGPYRDVMIWLYDTPTPSSDPSDPDKNDGYVWQQNDTSWSNGNNNSAPGRVRLWLPVPFRIYRDYSNQNSQIWGRVNARVAPPGTPTNCAGTTTPNYYNNVIRLGQ